MRQVARQHAAAIENMHAELDGLNDIGEDFFGARTSVKTRVSSFSLPVRLQSYFDKWIALFEFADDRVGFAEVHRRVVDHLAFALGGVDQAYRWSRR